MKYTEKELCKDTIQHRRDVFYVGRSMVKMLLGDLEHHDDDKLVDSTTIGTTYNTGEVKVINPAFLNMLNGGDDEWWVQHKQLGHHTPLNLLNLLEKIIDGVCACARRNENGLEGYTFIDTSSLDLEEIVRNTEAMATTFTSSRLYLESEHASVY